MDLFVKFLTSLGSSSNLIPVIIVLLGVMGWLVWSRGEWRDRALKLKNEKEDRQAERIQDQQNMIEVLRRENHRQNPSPPRPQEPDHSSTNRNQS
jgi:predicted negative regulator of RcsB-dependent stress response